MIERIDHVNLVVEDLESMTGFYRDVLELNVTKQATISGSWIEQVVGLAGVTADVVYLQPSSGARLELIKYRSPRGPAPPDLGAPNARGIRHVALAVGNIDATLWRLREAGTHVFSDVQQVPDTQVTFDGGVRKRLVYFHDPEGNLLELCEFKP